MKQCFGERERRGERERDAAGERTHLGHSGRGQRGAHRSATRTNGRARTVRPPRPPRRLLRGRFIRIKTNDNKYWREVRRRRRYHHSPPSRPVFAPPPPPPSIRIEHVHDYYNDVVRYGDNVPSDTRWRSNFFIVVNSIFSGWYLPGYTLAETHCQQPVYPHFSAPKKYVHNTTN